MIQGDQGTNQVLVVVSNIFQRAAVFLGPLLIDDSVALVVPPLSGLIDRDFEWLQEVGNVSRDIVPDQILEPIDLGRETRLNQTDLAR